MTLVHAVLLRAGVHPAPRDRGYFFLAAERRLPAGLGC